MFIIIFPIKVLFNASFEIREIDQLIIIYLFPFLKLNLIKISSLNYCNGDRKLVDMSILSWKILTSRISLNICSNCSSSMLYDVKLHRISYWYWILKVTSRCSHEISTLRFGRMERTAGWHVLLAESTEFRGCNGFSDAEMRACRHLRSSWEYFQLYELSW